MLPYKDSVYSLYDFYLYWIFVFLSYPNFSVCYTHLIQTILLVMPYKDGEFFSHHDWPIALLPIIAREACLNMRKNKHYKCSFPVTPDHFAMMAQFMNLQRVTVGENLMTENRRRQCMADLIRDQYLKKHSDKHCKITEKGERELKRYLSAINSVYEMYSADYVFKR